MTEDIGTEPTSNIRLAVNGTIYELEVPDRKLLSDVLRHDLELTGTHVGCEHGVCGACTVQLDGEPVRSCLMFAVTSQGHEITTEIGRASCRARVEMSVAGGGC